MRPSANQFPTGLSDVYGLAILSCTVERDGVFGIHATIRVIYFDGSGIVRECFNDIATAKRNRPEPAVKPASIRVDRIGGDTRPMARRYFGKEMGDAYVASNLTGASNFYRMQPEYWLTVDYAKAN